MAFRQTISIRTILASAAFAALLILGGGFAQAQDEAPAAGFNEKQKQEVQSIVRDYLKANPGAVVEALKAYQESQHAEMNKQFKQTLASRKADIFSEKAPFVGAKDADVTLVEFFDYNCGYCKKALKEVQTLLQSDPKLKIIFREFPILSPSSQDAARWAVAAGKQGKYFEYHVRLLNEPGEKNVAFFEKIGKSVGLDVEKLKKDADSKEVREEIEKDQQLGRDLGISGTPSFILGNTLIPGYLPAAEMESAIKAVRAGKEPNPGR